MPRFLIAIVCFVFASCNFQQEKKQKIGKEDPYANLSRQQKDAVNYFNGYERSRGYAPNTKSPKLIKKDSLESDYQIQYDEDIVLIAHQESKLKTLFYDHNVITSSNLPFYKGVNRISNFFEIPVIGESSIRRFGFWIWTPNALNPTEVYVELVNPNGKKDMTLKEFLKEAHLAYVSEYGLIV